MPIGYDPQGYPDTSPSAMAPSESEYAGAFLTWSVVIATVLTIGVVVTTLLFFYLRGRKRTHRYMGE